jgi:hypothetical protein
VQVDAEGAAAVDRAVAGDRVVVEDLAAAVEDAVAAVVVIEFFDLSEQEILEWIFPIYRDSEWASVIENRSCRSCSKTATGSISSKLQPITTLNQSIRNPQSCNCWLAIFH